MRAVLAAVAAAVALGAGLLVACSGASNAAGTASPAPASEAPSAPGGDGSSARPSTAMGRDAPVRPVPEPRPSVLGCVESRELKDYVLALEARRREARRAALAALGAAQEDRRGALGAAGTLALDQSYEAEGRRFAVAAELAAHSEPRVDLARQGAVLRRIDERPRAHAVDVLVCGIERCPPARTGGRVQARPLVVELGPGESWGGALQVGYDYWWARVRYPRRERCPSSG